MSNLKDFEIHLNDIRIWLGKKMISNENSHLIDTIKQGGFSYFSCMLILDAIFRTDLDKFRQIVFNMT